ncbi:ATP-dependent helicase HrpB [Brevirhabdus pacifica]|uniref:ATP-dependent helicase HrpB n=3 Tax=Brevirhabdus pacifica TaxID=1267768 RepID=A0A1U7DK71_9RHOB|nr:ATP-dependent helicase HrpB [Brevirhabdus pacifica]APX90417.1 ATP-dependent helicase HrpB [Brevirhabdus pacifica]OWU78560.1 ATP-dependent helicase [Loktanella sp. 22II-4b]PJJ85491.1 ATP-dependent helicase HrpB [Brevirhabdus pacifica]
MTAPQPLPIDDCLDDLLAALAGQGQAVLQAPPGAGKTTRVPLALLDAMRGQARAGRILMLEPRRLAAIAAAERMADILGEPVGQTVGYRIRGEARTGPETRIEVVTEGILTRMIQSDPELGGVAAVIFDEFHERSLNADLGLALALEIRGALREDLTLLVMSATLDAAPVAELMGGAPVITSSGRAYPVETRWLDRPIPSAAAMRGRGVRGPRPRDTALIATVSRAAQETEGGILVFLPGEAEIRRAASALAGVLPGNCRILPLYGALPAAEQRAAIAPLEGARKVVLSTAIAETSLTIDGIRVVVDGGLSRRARFDPGSGMSRLVTEPVTRAEADQRRGRAGRVAPGTCYRLWTKGEEGALPAFPPAEIEAGDLTGLALDLAEWGAPPEALSFLTPPPAGPMASARRLLRDLGAIAVPAGSGGGAGKRAEEEEPEGATITAHGKRLARMPMHPRLAHMMCLAAPAARPVAARLAALLGDRDILRGAPVDVALRLAILAGDRAGGGKDNGEGREANRAAVARIRAEAKRLERRLAGGAAKGGMADTGATSPGALAALAFPDRIGLRRPGDEPRWILSNGKGAVMDAGDPLGPSRLLVALDLDGDTREARIRLAAPLTEAELREVHADRIGTGRLCRWSRRDRRVEAREQVTMGALVLEDRAWKTAPPEAVAAAALDGVRDLGLATALAPSPAVQRLRRRVELLRQGGDDDMPDVTDAGLLERAAEWLLPHLGGCRSLADLRALDLLEPLRQWLGWDRLQRLDRLAPAGFTTPLGRSVPIDYEDEVPTIEVRLQEMFGLTRHPTVGPDRRPLRIALLSPARRPVQVTMDLPGFWTNSYADVRKDMRGRYPRHPWPEDPTTAAPTSRANPRKS